MKASEKKAIEQWAARLSDAQLEQAYYDAVYDSLGSQVEEMYARDYDMADIREQISLEKYRAEKAGLLEELCTARGIRIWEERQDAPEDAPVRLIDADALKDALCMFCQAMDSNMVDCNGDCMTHSIIDEQPTIEAEPVRHGRWIKDKDGFHHCSECGENTDRQEDAFGYDISEFKTIYCGNCGAKMDLNLPEETEDKPTNDFMNFINNRFNTVY